MCFNTNLILDSGEFGVLNKILGSGPRCKALRRGVSVYVAAAPAVSRRDCRAAAVGGAAAAVFSANGMRRRRPPPRAAAVRVDVVAVAATAAASNSLHCVDKFGSFRS